MPRWKGQSPPQHRATLTPCAPRGTTASPAPPPGLRGFANEINLREVDAGVLWCLARLHALLHETEPAIALFQELVLVAPHSKWAEAAKGISKSMQLGTPLQTLLSDAAFPAQPVGQLVVLQDLADETLNGLEAVVQSEGRLDGKGRWRQAVSLVDYDKSLLVKHRNMRCAGGSKEQSRRNKKRQAAKKKKKKKKKGGRR